MRRTSVGVFPGASPHALRCSPAPGREESVSRELVRRDDGKHPGCQTSRSHGAAVRLGPPTLGITLFATVMKHLRQTSFQSTTPCSFIACVSLCSSFRVWRAVLRLVSMVDASAVDSSS